MPLAATNELHGEVTHASRVRYLIAQVRASLPAPRPMIGNALDGTAPPPRLKGTAMWTQLQAKA